MDFTVGIVSRNLATTSNFVEFLESEFHVFRATECRVPYDDLQKTFDVTKVTYYMYSCDTCCMIREGGDEWLRLSHVSKVT